MRIEQILETTKEIDEMLKLSGPDMMICQLPQFIFAAYGDSPVLCGVFSMIMMEERSVINRLYIAEELVENEKDIFLAMLDTAWQKTREWKFDHMNYLYSGKGKIQKYEEELQLFGFEPYQEILDHIMLDAAEAERFFTDKSIQQWDKLDGNVKELSQAISQLPKLEQTDSLKNLMKDAQLYDIMETGVINLSFAYVKNQEIRLAVVATGKGNYVYIHSIVSTSNKREDIGYLFVLWRHMVKSAFEVMGENISFIIPIRSEEKGTMLKKLFEGYDYEEHMLYSAVKSEEEDDIPLVFQECLIKLYALADELAARGVETEITIPQLGLPFMQFEVEEKEFTIYYRQEKELEEQYNVVISVPLKEGEIFGEGPGREEIANPTNERILLANRLEKTGYDADITADILIMPFIKQIKAK